MQTSLAPVGLPPISAPFVTPSPPGTAESPAETDTNGAAETEASAAYKTLDGTPPIIIAHRGASGIYPEHTLKAYQTAIDQGADFIEPDLVMTKDGVLVANHDGYLSDTTNVSEHAEFADRKTVRKTPMGDLDDWWSDDFTLAELKTLKAIQRVEGRSHEHDGQYDIATFDEIIDLVGEITNMVTGGAKRMLSEKGFEFDMATPIVVSGKAHTIHHKSKGPVVIISIKGEVGKAYIEFSFDE